MRDYKSLISLNDSQVSDLDAYRLRLIGEAKHDETSWAHDLFCASYIYAKNKRVINSCCPTDDIFQSSGIKCYLV